MASFYLKTKKAFRLYGTLTQAIRHERYQEPSVKIPLADQKVLVVILDITQKIHDHPGHFLFEQPVTREYYS